jgi:leucyl-tRNA synthetase
MSKSRGNVINPDEVIKNYGADSMRVYEMFMGPLEVSKPWNTSGLIGVTRFLERLYAIGEKPVSEKMADGEDALKLKKLLHRTIKKVTSDTASLDFNTAISAMMICSSELAKLSEIPRALWEPFVIMLGAYAPHLGEELWEKLGYKETVSACKWPTYDEALIREDEVTVVVQVNGKVRDKFTAATGTAGAELEKTALSLPGILKWTGGHKIAKVIVVPQKLVNVVLGN